MQEPSFIDGIGVEACYSGLDDCELVRIIESSQESEKKMLMPHKNVLFALALSLFMLLPSAASAQRLYFGYLELDFTRVPPVSTALHELDAAGNATLVDDTGFFFGGLETGPNGAFIGFAPDPAVGSAVYSVDPSDGTSRVLFANPYPLSGAIAFDETNGFVFGINSPSSRSTLVAVDIQTELPVLSLEIPLMPVGSGSFRALEFTRGGDLILSSGGLFRISAEQLAGYSFSDGPLVAQEHLLSDLIMTELGATSLGDLDLRTVGGREVLAVVYNNEDPDSGVSLDRGIAQFDFTTGELLSTVTTPRLPLLIASTIPAPSGAALVSVAGVLAARRRRRA